MGHLQEGKRIYVSASDPAYINRPNIDGGKFFCNGEIREWTGAMQTVYAPIFLEGTEVRRARLGYPQVFSSIETVFLGFVAREASRHLGCRNETRVRRRQKKCDHPKPKPLCVQDKVEIGRQARLTPTEALEALEAARAAWDNGKGVWPQTPFQGRIAAMEKFVARLKTKRDVIVNVLMWEICKVRADAEKEFDRTIDYINATLKAAKEMRNKESTLSDVSGVLAQVRRNPIGVMLNLGPFNYPFNETYTTLIPSILMGNTVVMKLPNVGCLAHISTMEVFKECFPKGTVNFISGAGRETMPPIMATGHVDIFAFIGGSKAADALIKNVPNPHKVKFCLSLDAKNLCVVLPDADVDAAVKECVLGALSYNGQRCTALKLLMVHSSILEEFRTKFVAKMGELKLGLPWDQGTDLTPLPEPGKPAYLAELREDAVAKGAQLYSPGEDQGWGSHHCFPLGALPGDQGYAGVEGGAVWAAGPDRFLQRCLGSDRLRMHLAVRTAGRGLHQGGHQDSWSAPRRAHQLCLARQHQHAVPAFARLFPFHGAQVLGAGLALGDGRARGLLHPVHGGDQALVRRPRAEGVRRQDLLLPHHGLHLLSAAPPPRRLRRELQAAGWPRCSPIHGKGTRRTRESGSAFRVQELSIFSFGLPASLQAHCRALYSAPWLAGHGRNFVGKMHWGTPRGTSTGGHRARARASA